MDLKKKSVMLHKKHLGKISVESKVRVKTKLDLSLAYTPGVAEPCRRIAADEKLVYELTSKWNLVAVVSDGTAVLGLGDIGPEAAMPVMEGKAVLMKTFAGIDGFPVCLSTKDPDKIVETVKFLEPTFGGINLEDISAPRCFEVESRLKKETKIPIFHDDQHGTAIIVLAALKNALKLVGKNLEDVGIVINGAGAAGVALAKIMASAGCGNIVLCDRAGIIHSGRVENMNWAKKELAEQTNPENKKGGLAEALIGSDVFIGVSGPNLVSKKMVQSMAKKPVVFALANPDPEILPKDAKAAGAEVVGTGRSDFANQINNVLAFPGVFRGALDTRARDINEAMKLAASEALAELVSEKELSTRYVIPKPLDPRVAPAVAEAVARAAIKSQVARKKPGPGKVAQHTRKLVSGGKK